jgi:NAD-dependent deacetylase
MPNNIEDTIRDASEAIRRAERVAVLTGAGVSAESGVPTFRASDGLWEGHRIEDVASPDGYRRDPALVWSFYNGRRKTAAGVKPNPGHDAIVKLESLRPTDFCLITQNVDGLHQRAGSKNVLELHGSLRRTRCPGCGEIVDRGLEDLGPSPTCPSCAAPVRPDIVWFGEMLSTTLLQDASAAVLMCDVLLVVGTSAVVHPAAGLIDLAKRRDQILPGRSEPATVIEFNLSETAASELADIQIFGPSGETLPKVVALI